MRFTHSKASVDSAVKTCPNPEINIGIFFDGTGMNGFNLNEGRRSTQKTRRLSGRSYNSSEFSNVWSLFQSYRTPNQSVSNGCGEDDRIFIPLYIDGIGTQRGGPDRTQGLAFGLGETGVETRVEEAIGRSRNALGPYANHRAIKLDVFGFSRGAFAARVFCNRVRDGALAEAEVRFLGLFDTVGALGLNPRNADNLGLDVAVTAATAQTVVHFTALGEIRDVYALTSLGAGPGVELPMPGSHGDVGGGWSKSQTLTEVHIFTANRPSRRRTYREDNGWFDTAVSTRRAGIPGRSRVPVQIYTRQVRPGLELTALVAMREKAIAAGTGISPRAEGSLRHDGRIIPSDLQSVYRALLSDLPLASASVRPLTAKYAHWSAGNLFAGNWAEPDYERDIILSELRGELRLPATTAIHAEDLTQTANV